MSRRAMALAVAIGLCAALPAHAQKVSFKSPDQLKEICKATGGTFVPPSGPESTYECIGKGDNGAVVVCGGIGGYASTCESLRDLKLDAARLARLKSGNVLQVAPGN